MVATRGATRNRQDAGSPPARGTGSDGVRRATGRTRAEWFATLDAAGMRGRPYRETAGLLVDEHGLSRWWAQKLTVEYEQARGRRKPGARPDGTFTVTATKTVAAPVARAFAAFADPKARRRWLPDVRLRKRGSEQGRSLRFDHADGTSRVNVTFAAAPNGKTQVAVEHVRLPDAEVAAGEKARWRERLTAYKAGLER
jgi:hypothetical protein